jgi:subtilisin family serine protease
LRSGLLLRFHRTQLQEGRSALEAAGFRVATSQDFRFATSVPNDLDGADVHCFARFGLAIVRGDPERASALVRSIAERKPLFSMRRERHYRARASVASVAGVAEGGHGPEWGLRSIQAHVSQLTGAGIKVAVLDSGLDTSHRDFKGRLVTHRLFASHGVPADVSGHGTACIGVACGPLQPHGVGRYGVAHAAEIYAGKVVGDDDLATDHSMLAGLEWALDQRCEVISMSLGDPVSAGDAPDAEFEHIGRTCLDAGTLVIAAAGNGSQRPGFIAPVESPANAASILSVGALNRALRAAPTTSGGLIAGQDVDIAAPGVGILTAKRGGGHERIDGTSMAASFVAGVAALIAQSNPTLRGRALWQELLRLARPISASPRDAGRGLLQAPPR